MEIQMIDITKTHPFEGCPFKVQKEESCSAFSEPEKWRKSLKELVVSVEKTRN